MRCRVCKCPRAAGLDDYVFDCLTRMYRGFEDQRQRIDPATIYDVRYEDLIANPASEVKKMYREAGFGTVRDRPPKIEAFVEGQKDYKTNKHRVDEGPKARIRERWKAISKDMDTPSRVVPHCEVQIANLQLQIRICSLRFAIA